MLKLQLSERLWQQRCPPPNPRCSQTDAARMRCAEVGLAEGDGVWVDNRCFQTD